MESYRMCKVYSLSIMLLRFIHALTCVSNFFLRSSRSLYGHTTVYPFSHEWTPGQFLGFWAAFHFRKTPLAAGWRRDSRVKRQRQWTGREATETVLARDDVEVALF